MAGNQPNRREQILEIALKRFATDGYVATSTRDLCADLKMTRSAIYNYFASKEDIILAIEEREMTGMLSQLEAIKATTAGSTQLALVQVVAFVCQQALTRQKSWRLMADMIRSLKEDNRRRVIRRRDAVEGIVREVLTESVEEGLIFERNIKLACLQLFSMAEGMSGWYRKNGPNKAEEIVEHASEFFLSAVRATPETLAALHDWLAVSAPVKKREVRSK